MKKDNQTLKVIFLDIDGVLNSERTRSAFGRLPQTLEGFHLEFFDQVALALLRSLCRHKDISIVVSSSWRTDNAWAYIGKQLALPVIGATPSLAAGRGDEVDAWLSDNPTVEKYAILDDIASGFGQHHEKHLVLVDGKEGLLLRDVAKLCDIFGCKTFDLYRSSTGRKAQ